MPETAATRSYAKSRIALCRYDINILPFLLKGFAALTNKIKNIIDQSNYDIDFYQLAELHGTPILFYSEFALNIVYREVSRILNKCFKIGSLF